ncbi:Forkhead-associated protein [Chthoniobacter flavus Ellin428]|uniref:Forkhead-associated protein n=1 Tax=Chthoniobacter flavus Ellin428 TaxID=497964 RepID=B4D8F6_9BACT|nr:FHA domain-containing protein [Chthoniobacter flavus]EDY17349.1 Forkhead-associated protein [Chthoniobacter flavus Ellin428]TCO90082.1 FHA domain-containing protein [Chthoniobacter flavus]
MSDNDEKTRIVRPLEQLQRAANSDSDDTDPTRKVERDDTLSGAGETVKPIRSGGEEKTVLFRPSPNRGEGTLFNPLAPRTESGGDSDDPVVGWLVIVRGPGRGNAVRLGYGWNSIGRDASQRACLDFGDSQISRLNHAKLLYDPRGRKFTLTLGEGTNPTYLRDEALLGPTQLQNGDRMQMGDTELLFVALCGETFDWQDNS